MAELQLYSEISFAQCKLDFSISTSHVHVTMTSSADY